MSITEFPIEVIRIPELPQGTPGTTAFIIFNIDGNDRRVSLANFIDFVQGELPFDSTLPQVVDSDVSLEISRTYYFTGNYTATLPSPVGLQEGQFLTVMKKRGTFPTIQRNGSLSEEIITDNGTYTSTPFDVDKAVRFVWNGDDWDVIT